MLKVVRRMRKTRQVASPVGCEPASSNLECLPTKRLDPQDTNPATEKAWHTNDQTISSSSLENNAKAEEMPPAEIMITGGGIVGLLMALALHKHLHIKAEVYEQAHGFEPDVGAGMGLYANGLRVIQDIDPDLLKDIQQAGHPYMYRRWERHDGTEVAVSDETVLGSTSNREPVETGEDASIASDLQTMGIRRWRFQQCLHKAVKKREIPIYFEKEVATVTTPENGTTEVVFTDGTRRQTQLLIGADGGRSAVRTALLQQSFDSMKQDGANRQQVQLPSLNYTGVTCIMGVAENNGRQGISFPVSNTTRCHGVFYPTGSNEQCFQFHFPTSSTKKRAGDECEKEDSCWGNLSQQVSHDECTKLAEILEADGWNEDKYIEPLRNVTRAVRVGFCQLTPALKRWSFPNVKGQPRTVLVGDAAHPPVPYIGQGAQQGMEDVGTLALLLKTFCLDDQGAFDLLNLNYAIAVYEKLRIPRVEEVLGNARYMGNMQQKRAQNPAYNIIKEEMIQRDVFFHETMPIMFPGARYDYREALEKELKQMAKEHNGPPLRSIAE